MKWTTIALLYGTLLHLPLLVAQQAVGDRSVQNLPSSSSNPAESQKIYGERCVGCHGADARGTDQAPGLAGNPRMRGRSVQELRGVIRNGIPGTGMPPFDLPARELDALAKFVYSLNGEAAATDVPGDVAAGERFFFGNGRCASCHMVSGRGRPVGPDLSSVGHTMALHEIRLALLQPGADIAPGYEVANVQLRDGKTLRGFLRSRSNFDLRLQDFEGKLYLLQEGQIAAIQEENASLMPPVKASPEELQNLLAYLSRLTGVKHGDIAAPQPHEAGDIDFTRILNP